MLALECTMQVLDRKPSCYRSSMGKSENLESLRRSYLIHLLWTSQVSNHLNAPRIESLASICDWTILQESVALLLLLAILHDLDGRVL